MFVAILLVLGGLLFLAIGGELTVRGGSSLAARFRIQPYVIGATVIAFGTSAPELAVTLTASVKGVPDIALGNVVGSNIANLGLILGLAALLKPVILPRKILRNEWPIVILVLATLIGFGWDGVVSRVEGVLLLAGMGYAMYRTLQKARAGRVSVEAAETPHYSTLRSTIFVLIGLALLYLGGQVLVEGAVRIAEAFGVAQWVIGVVVVAVGTSMPEVAASLVAALRGRGDIAIGNVLGSNAFNTLLVLGSGSAIQPMQVALPIHIDLLVFGFLTLFTLGVLAWRHTLSRATGGVLFATYIAYIAFRVLTRT